MGTAQTGIFTEGSTHSWFLEYVIRPDSSVPDVSAAIAAVHGSSIDEASQVMAFGPDLWRLLGYGAPEFQPFKTLAGPKARASSTQHDLFIWLHGGDADSLLERMMIVQQQLQTVAELRVEVKGFRYRDSRDLTGFVDGTANPKGDDRMIAALIPEGAPGAGGSFVLSQRWQHQLQSFSALPVSEQEKVIGRTKQDDVELTGDAMPADSHVSRTDVSGMKIYRRSMPWANAREQGLFFLAFACSQERFDVQLARMFGVHHDKLSDRLLAFSDATHSSYWFAPALEILNEIR